MLTVLVLGFLIVYILVKGVPHLTPQLFAWEYDSENVSMLPSIINTCFLTLLALAVSLLFTVGALFFPEALLSIYSRDPAVIEAGTPYLRIVGASYIVTALAKTMSFACRSTGQVRLPMVTSLI